MLYLGITYIEKTRPLQTRADSKRVFDIKYATSLEQEKVRNYFLESNDRWQARALARQIEDDEEDRRWREENAEADKVREGDERRKGSERFLGVVPGEEGCPQKEGGK